MNQTLETICTSLIIRYKDIKLKGDPNREKIKEMMGADYLNYTHHLCISDNLAYAAGEAVLWCLKEGYLRSEDINC